MRQRKAKPTAAASERGFGKNRRSIAGDVELPSLLPLLLLLAACCCCCVCSLILPLLAAAAAAAAAAAVALVSI